MSQYSIFIHFNKPGATVMSLSWVQESLLCLAFALAASYTMNCRGLSHSFDANQPPTPLCSGKVFTSVLVLFAFKMVLYWFGEYISRFFLLKGVITLVLRIRLNHRSVPFLTLFPYIGALLVNNCSNLMVRWLVDSLPLSVVFI